MARTADPVALVPCPFPRMLIGKLRFPEAPRPCSAPGMPGTAAPALACGIPGVRGGGEGRSEGRGSAPGSRGARAAASPAPQLRAGACGRGLRTPGPGAPVRFFPRIPGRGAGPGVGRQSGGFPPSCEQRTGPSPGWELRRAEARRRAGEPEPGGERGAPPSGHWGERGRTEPPRGPVRRVGRWPRSA